MRKKRLLVCVVIALTVTASSAIAAEVTFKSLLTEMTDLEGLSHMPDPAFICKQFSSYDRNSTDPKALTDDNWFANGDRGKYLREEERGGAKEYVLMDAEGPGAIVRIWSADPKDAGTIRIYFDNNESPAIEMPMEEMLLGKTAPFVEPIACMRAQGWNSYLPLPYAKHCKVTSSLPDFYYHINYRTYAQGANVKTLSKEDVEICTPGINAVAAALAAPDKAAGKPKRAKGGDFGYDIAPGKSIQMAKLPGPGAVYELTLRVEAPDLEAALRGVLMTFSVDDVPIPTVMAPIGDFFGSAPGNRPYKGLPCGVMDDGTFYSHWVMPFKQGAVLRFDNMTENPVSLRGTVWMARRHWTSDSLYFNAKWRIEKDIPTRPRQDWKILFAQGHGRFAGCMLQLMNPVGAWWGEGDEKIYVDGEKFPSHFGTGSEDYFCYAWGCPEVYSHAYHSQPRCDGPGNLGHTCVNRFHILDNIPFNQACNMDIEVWHWENCKITQAVTAYWYSGVGGTDTFVAPNAEDMTVAKVPEPKHVEGALEGETMKVAAKDGGSAAPQTGGMGNWSNMAQMWWIDAKPGETLTLGFPVVEAGRYEVIAVFTKARDYGIADVSVNDGNARSFDFYNDGVITTPEESLGVSELKVGENQLKVKITGANPMAEPRHMFGLDYLLLKPAK
ncbi:MAG TPA: DUF2961 domain-containing protein [Candidatus Hydrogenedentes bacterium]|nr:DUF2961 domain-containing protein [Candidatus Hydrogenedentota bacterium]